MRKIDIEQLILFVVSLVVFALVTFFLYGLYIKYQRVYKLINATTEQEVKEICITFYGTSSLKNLPAQCIKYYQ